MISTRKAAQARPDRVIEPHRADHARAVCDTSSRRRDLRADIVRPGYPMLTACGSINGTVGQFQLTPSVVLLDRLEVVMKSPVREAYPQVAGGDIGEAEMNTQPHSCVDNVRTQSPSTVVVTGSTWYCG
jgi:hypothetical protein